MKSRTIGESQTPILSSRTSEKPDGKSSTLFSEGAFGKRPAELLRHHFGYHDFRPMQKEIIDSVLSGHDTLAIMPTGGGKSVCYQIPSLLFEGVTVVISPLISLMKDQIDQLEHIGIGAVMLNSSLDADAYRENIGKILSGKAKLLYLAPETLFKSVIIDTLKNVRVNCIAVDEAHCISDWGHDFRPEYRQIVKLRAIFPRACCLALTATATPRVQSDIRKNLQMRDESVFIASFDRENLFFQVKPKTNASAQIIEFLAGYKNQPGIIYCFSRAQVDSVAALLIKHGYAARPYHAGLSDSERRQNQELFARDEVQIIVATIAFGMGINKTNVRFVIHHDLPKSIESYYQETGRAGRDGEAAHCLLLYSYGDVSKIQYFINQKSDENEKSAARQHLSHLIEYAESSECRRRPLLAYFGEKYEEVSCTMCDNCTGEKVESADFSRQAQMFLSCVMRTGERFGSAHIIEVLRGSQSQKILKFDHHRLSTYGIGKEWSKAYWSHLARSLISRGALVQDAEEFNSLHCTALGYAIMKGAGQFTAPRFVEAEKTQFNVKTSAGYDSDLFMILRSERKQIADAEGVPPYVVFSDKTLAEMAHYFPQNKNSMMSIYGVGDTKFERYGEIFIRLIKDYCGDRGVEEKTKTPISAVSKNTGTERKFVTVTGEYQNGKSITQLADEHRVKTQTIVNHLYEYVRNFGPIDTAGLREYAADKEELCGRIMEYYEASGTESLGAAFAHFGGEADYETLAVFRTIYLCERGGL